MLPRMEGPGKNGVSWMARKQTPENFSMPLLGHEVSPLPSLLGYPTEGEAWAADCEGHSAK